MLVLEYRCKWCAAVRKNKQLLERIYNSKFFLPHGKESLAKIAKETGMSYNALQNHVHRHQFIDSQDYTEKMLQNADKKAEKKAVRKAVRAVSAVQTVIDRGMERLESGEIDVDTNQLIRASQVKIAQEGKAKDQELATIEMVAHFLSGESAGDRVYIEPNDDINEVVDTTNEGEVMVSPDEVAVLPDLEVVAPLKVTKNTPQPVVSHDLTPEEIRARLNK